MCRAGTKTGHKNAPSTQRCWQTTGGVSWTSWKACPWAIKASQFLNGYFFEEATRHGRKQNIARVGPVVQECNEIMQCIPKYCQRAGWKAGNAELVYKE